MLTTIDRERIVDNILTVYIKCNVRSFPLDCFTLLKNYNFRIYSYDWLKKNNSRIYELCRSFSDDAFIWEDIVAYNERQHPSRIRFSLMHEFAHFILNHPEETQKTEAEADFFASNILAPRLMMYRLQCKNADDIHATFDISYAAANRAIKDYHRWVACDADQKMSAWFFPPEPDPTNLPEEVKVIESETEKSALNNSWVPSIEFEERRAKVLARLRRQKRKNQRQLKQYEEDMEFLGGYDPDAAFARAEHQWLYGSDL